MKMKFFSLLFFLVFLSLLPFSQSGRYNALFNFGDSLSDTGNVVIAGLPYGMTYFGKATGRCSDGRLIIDFIAEGIGLPHLPPNTVANASFDQGANFAFIAATTLPFAFFHERNLSKGLWVNASIHEQIDRFQNLLPSICGSPQDCKDFLSGSLLVVGEFGGNDYSTGLFASRTIAEVSTFAPSVAAAIGEGIERLIGLGAVDLIVPALLPVGCFPLYLTLYNTSDSDDYGPRTGCMRRHNALSWYHNKLLRRQLDHLRLKYPAVSIRYADLYSQVFDFAVNPLKYGFRDGALRTCCGAPGSGRYNFNMRAKCDQNGSSVCPDPTTHVSWDGIHMTETAHRIIAAGWLHGPYLDPPF
ncbi:GDSL esterase/lipase At1g28600-like [Zingiber officinale]|uniref:GDSL esterase/lipase n=1 Tax=Zingiber officinale TaxID=94328 RepID=A0A8J5H6D0_ZINOF|nr:GDSL esterase/lipase At1g28600-like [Zingiber officinale]KAG6521555.1 hypothetical protein ZIOFF_018678 [Zingiber officinale]